MENIVGELFLITTPDSFVCIHVGGLKSGIMIMGQWSLHFSLRGMVIVGVKLLLYSLQVIWWAKLPYVSFVLM